MSDERKPPILPKQPELYHEGDLEKFVGCLAGLIEEDHPIEMDVTREERIRVLMKRRSMRCPGLARRLARRGIAVKPDTLYRMLNRTVNSNGRGRAAHVKRILAGVEAVLEEGR